MRIVGAMKRVAVAALVMAALSRPGNAILFCLGLATAGLLLPFALAVAVAGRSDSERGARAFLGRTIPVLLSSIAALAVAFGPLFDRG